MKPELEDILKMLLSLSHDDLYEFNKEYQAKLKHKLVVQNNN